MVLHCLGLSDGLVAKEASIVRVADTVVNRCKSVEEQGRKTGSESIDFEYIEEFVTREQVAPYALGRSATGHLGTSRLFI